MIDPSDPTPLYHQIFSHYRDRILSGLMRDGAPLPSEGELVRLHSVSRITARRAMTELVRIGLASRHRGRGTVVDHKEPATAVTSDFHNLLDGLASIDAGTKVRLLAFDYGPAPKAVAKALELPATAVVQISTRLRSRADGTPFSTMLTHIPEAIGRTFDESDLTRRPILSLIERGGHPLASAEQSMTAVAADGTVCDALDVEAGAPLLRVTRVLHDVHGTPVQHIVIHYRPDAYHMEMSLRRDPSTAQRLNWNVSGR